MIMIINSCYIWWFALLWWCCTVRERVLKKTYFQSLWETDNDVGKDEDNDVDKDEDKENLDEVEEPEESPAGVTWEAPIVISGLRQGLSFEHIETKQLVKIIGRIIDKSLNLNFNLDLINLDVWEHADKGRVPKKCKQVWSFTKP